MSTDTLTVIPPEEMERAYLEYRRSCYLALHRHAAQRGLLKALDVPTSLTQLSDRMAFAPSQRHTLKLLLRALTIAGSVTTIDENGQVFIAAEPNDAPLDQQRIVTAIGAEALEDLIHGDSYPGIIDTLFDGQNRVAAAFIADNLPLWEEFLSTPFYRYNRLKAVERIAPAGSIVADIACGPGFGLAELADRTTVTGTVHGFEISPDFAAEAIRRTAHLPHVVVTRCDVDGSGLAFLGDNLLDGAMMVGAFHFLTDPDGFLKQLHRVLRPGAPVSLSYAYMKRGSYDQALTDLRFSLREPTPYPRDERSMVELVSRNGFTLESSYPMGCYQSFVFQTT
ncbi:MAG: methyltransferase domain-containing protein [Egibacteraceae bacterium]